MQGITLALLNLMVVIMSEHTSTLSFRRAEFYFKRQEEMKKLALADEDDYLNSSWADPKGMKKSLQGLNDVKAPGFR